MPRRVLRAAIVVVAVGLVILMESAGFLATAPEHRPTLSYTMAHAAVGITYAICAALSWRISDAPWPGRLMVLIAILWIPQTLYAAIDTVGWLWPLVVAVDLCFAVLIGALVLLYPSGRVISRLDRAVVVAGLSAVLIRAAAAVTMDDAGSGGRSRNPYSLVGDTPVYHVIDLAFHLVGAILILVVGCRVVVRWLRSSPPARTAAFAMPIALLAWGASVVYLTVRINDHEILDDVVGYFSLLATAAVPISYLSGLSYIRNLRGRASDLMLLAADGVDRSGWQASLASTLRDPGLRVYWYEREEGGYRDAVGAPMPEQPSGLGRHRTGRLAIDSADGPIAVIDHDSALGEQGELLEAVTSAVRLSIDNQRLRRQLEASLHEVRESRVRIIEAALAARTRIERDLHDGSQQALVSLALGLRMAATRARREGADGVADDLDRSSEQLAGALRGLRELARGIHPTALTVGGLATALPELASSCPLPVALELQVVERLPSIVESTIYFVVAECLTNTVRHSGASRCRVRVELHGDELAVRIIDDGAGGAGVGKGTGLLGLADRVEALGGTLEVASPVGAGTVVTAVLPIGDPVGTI